MSCRACVCSRRGLFLEEEPWEVMSSPSAGDESETACMRGALAGHGFWNQALRLTPVFLGLAL